MVSHYWRMHPDVPNFQFYWLVFRVTSRKNQEDSVGNESEPEEAIPLNFSLLKLPYSCRLLASTQLGFSKQPVLHILLTRATKGARCGAREHVYLASACPCLSMPVHPFLPSSGGWDMQPPMLLWGPDSWLLMMDQELVKKETIKTRGIKSWLVETIKTSILWILWRKQWPKQEYRRNWPWHTDSFGQISMEINWIGGK